MCGSCGTPTLSSTQREWSSIGSHGLLTVLGMIPGIGEFADGIEALYCLAEGDMACAAMSASAMIPFLGWGAAIGKLGKLGGKAADAANSGRAIPFGPASDDAWAVLNRVDAKGSPLPGYKGGKVWDNNGTQGAQVLPRGGADGSAVTYREWDLTQKVKGVDRDGRRLVTGSNGSAYYTTDHYVSFIQIR